MMQTVSIVPFTTISPPKEINTFELANVKTAMHAAHAQAACLGLKKDFHFTNRTVRERSIDINTLKKKQFKLLVVRMKLNKNDHY